MAKHEIRPSLSWKLLAALLTGAVLALALFFVLQTGGDFLIRRTYLAPGRVQARVGKEISSFRDYVDEKNVYSSDASAIGAWNREHPYVMLTVTGRDTIVTSDRNGATLLLVSSALSLRAGEGTVYEFPVTFRDGPFSVEIYEFSETKLPGIVTVLSFILSGLVFLTYMSLYERRVIRSVQKLSRQVQTVSRGDLQTEIVPQTNDEIGALASDVDAMRLSIIDRLKGEQEAWQANKDLITAISHDIRTPLTALTGYLEILSDDSPDPETREAYLKICRNHCGRLKELTDDLFRFFLVFGQPVPQQELEPFDAPTLIQQILLEAQLELSRDHLELQILPVEPFSGTVCADLKNLRRVFDNIWSNLRKYADAGQPVTAGEAVKDGYLEVFVTNFVRRDEAAAESSKIGLKTCEKLLSAMDGSFEASRDGERFTAKIRLPLQKTDPV